MLKEQAPSAPQAELSSFSLPLSTLNLHLHFPFVDHRHPNRHYRSTRPSCPSAGLLTNPGLLSHWNPRPAQ